LGRRCDVKAPLVVLRIGELVVGRRDHRRRHGVDERPVGTDHEVRILLCLKGGDTRHASRPLESVARSTAQRSRRIVSSLRLRAFCRSAVRTERLWAFLDMP
jgi:hypothetical protein